MSIKEYISHKKMVVASQMLLAYDITIEELAECLHYESVYTFRQAFKKYYDDSPTKYKRKKKI